MAVLSAPMAVDSDTRQKIRAWVKHYLAARELTQDQFAELIGVKGPTITNIVNDKRGAGLEVVVKMHRVLGRSIDDFVDSYPKERK